MKITGVKINLKNNEVKDNSLLATASVTFDNAVVVKGIRILNSRNDEKPWIAMAASKQNNGTYREYYHPINSDFRDEMSNLILNSYLSVLENPDDNIFNFDIEPDPINITRTKIYILNNTQNIKAVVSMILDNKFILEQMHIVKRKDNNELFFTMPSRALPDKTYMNIYNPTSNEAREILTKAAFNAYDSAIRQ